MPGVPAVLLDQVEEEPAQAGTATVGPRLVDELVESAVGHGRVEPLARPFDGAIPERVELFRGVVGSRDERPVGDVALIRALPRFAGRVAAQPGSEVEVLDKCEVLEQAAEGERGRGYARLQPRRVEPARLPAEGRAKAVERTDEVLVLGAGGRWFPWAVAVSHGGIVELSADRGSCRCCSGVEHSGHMADRPGDAPKVAEVEREDSIVMFLEVEDSVPQIGAGWDSLEALLGELRGRRFLGAVQANADTYRVCVELRDGDRPDELGLQTGRIPGGRYLRLRLRGEPPEVYDRIVPAVELLERTAPRDDSRPLIEAYRRRNQVDVLMPVHSAVERGRP